MDASSDRGASILNLLLCKATRHTDLESRLGLPFSFARRGAQGGRHFLEAGDEDVLFDNL